MSRASTAEKIIKSCQVVFIAIANKLMLSGKNPDRHGLKKVTSQNGILVLKDIFYKETLGTNNPMNYLGIGN